jgi:hypothetical protein
MTKEGETPLHRFLFSPVTKLLHRYIDFDHILQFEHQMWTESSTIADFMHSETFFQYRASKGQLLVDPARAVHQTFQDTETKIEDQLRHLRDFKIQALKKKQEALTRGVQSLTKQVSESGIGLESSRVRELPVISHKSLPLPRIRTAV